MLLPPLRPGPELGGIQLAGAGLAGLYIVGGVELGLRCGGGLLGLGEGATVLGLDRPQTTAMVLVGPRGLLDATRQLRCRRHWSDLRRRLGQERRRRGVEAEVRARFYILWRRMSCVMVNLASVWNCHGPLVVHCYRFSV
jgi:hypothetical protein